MQSGSAYNAVDRFIHYLAFSNPVVQKSLHELENDLFRSQFKPAEEGREVFVAGLPRSGTTLLLELLYGTGEFVTFTYRQMPFILSPLIWDKASRLFRKKAEKRERAHGDGMEVSFDSPEAFEEVIWLTYFRDAFVRKDRILPLPADLAAEPFETSLRATIGKLSSLEASGRGGGNLRYLSKNNANIGRLALIARLFPTSTILIPFRHPLSHVASLMRQHERFLREHEQDGFSRRYMRWLGHFEFGADFKPIDFDGWFGERLLPPRLDAGFWLEYWTAAYSHAIANRPANAVFVDFDEMLRNGVPALTRLARVVGVEDERALTAGADGLREPTSGRLDPAECPETAWQAAQKVHARLIELDGLR